MDVEAASLFDPDTWQMMLQEKAVYDVEKKACNDRMGQMNWPYPELLTISVDRYSTTTYAARARATSSRRWTQGRR